MCSILKETHREKINLADEAITMESVTMHCEPVQRACCCIIEMNLRNEWEKKGLDVERANGYRSVSIIFFLSYRKNKRIFPKSNSTYRELFNLFNNSEFRCVSLFRLCVVEAHFRFEKKFKIRNLKFSNPSEKEKEFHSFLFPFFVICIPVFIETRTARGARKRERGLGKWNTANGPMTPWHTFHASSQRKWKESTDLRSSDLRHAYLTDCISIEYASSSLNEDRKIYIYIYVYDYWATKIIFVPSEIDILTRWRLRADCTNRLYKLVLRHACYVYTHRNSVRHWEVSCTFIREWK